MERRVLIVDDVPDMAQVLEAELRDVGFDPVDVGPLRMARYMEPFALLVAQVAYEVEDGPEVAYRFERFT